MSPRVKRPSVGPGSGPRRPRRRGSAPWPSLSLCRAVQGQGQGPEQRAAAGGGSPLPPAGGAPGQPWCEPRAGPRVGPGTRGWELLGGRGWGALPSALLAAPPALGRLRRRLKCATLRRPRPLLGGPAGARAGAAASGERRRPLGLRRGPPKDRRAAGRDGGLFSCSAGGLRPASTHAGQTQPSWFYTSWGSLSELGAPSPLSGSHLQR